MFPEITVPLLKETLQLAGRVADPVWPTQAQALGALLSRGAAHLEAQSADTTGGEEDDHAAALSTEAQYHFTRYAAFHLTQESRRLETEWLALADAHLALRQRIVEARRAEEQLKRDLAATGAAVVRLPEHEDLPEIPPDRPRKSRDMYATLFDGVEATVARLSLPAEQLARVDRVVERSSWGGEWGELGRLIVFCYGVAAANSEAEREQHDESTALQRARERLMGVEGKYATLRFRLFELQRNHRILGWRITALRIEAGAMERRLAQFDADAETLRGEIEARAGLVAPPPPAAPARTGWRARLSRLLQPPER
ncbi:MAG: hypothetical protein U0821_08110 [Chloroflexota bacterium]